MAYNHPLFSLLLLPVIFNGFSLQSHRNNKGNFYESGYSPNQSGLYYEISMDQKSPDGVTKGILKIYIDPSDNVRVESQSTTYPGSGKTTQTQISISNDPSHTMLIDNKSREYTINTVYRGPSPLKDANVPPVISKVGSDTVNGFPCTILNIAAPEDSCKLWISDAVPDYTRLDKALQLTMALGMDNGDWVFLSKKGYKGIWVKYVATDSEDKGLTLELVKAERVNVSEALMKPPAGYKKLSSYDFAMKHHE